MAGIDTLDAGGQWGSACTHTRARASAQRICAVGRRIGLCLYRLPWSLMHYVCKGKSGDKQWKCKRQRCVEILISSMSFLWGSYADYLLPLIESSIRITDGFYLLCKTPNTTPWAHGPYGLPFLTCLLAIHTCSWNVPPVNTFMTNFQAVWLAGVISSVNSGQYLASFVLVEIFEVLFVACK